MVERLFGHISDDAARREKEQTVQDVLAEFGELTVLTNTYYDEEEETHILQLSTYNGGELYGGEIVLPEEEEEGEISFVGPQVDAMLQSMEEKISQ